MKNLYNKLLDLDKNLSMLIIVIGSYFLKLNNVKQNKK